MMLEALGQAALRTLLLTAAIQLGLWLFRITRARLLLMAWTVVLAASLAMPVLQWATPFRVTNIPGLPGISLDGPNIAPIGETGGEWQFSIAQEVRPDLTHDLDRRFTIGPWLQCLYLVVSGILLLRLGVGVALAFRVMGRAAPVCLTWAAKARVRISSDIAAPVTVFNVILLPADFVDWPFAMRQAALAHERSHVARRDFALLLLAQVNRALFWFSPLSWWLYRHLATLAELTSDDDAVKVMGDRPGYAEILLEMGRRSGPLLRGLAMAQPATLSHRIERLLSSDARLDPVSWVQGMIVTIGVAALSIAAAIPDHDAGSPSGLTTLPERRLPSVPSGIQSPTLSQAEDPPSPPVPPTHTDVASRALPQSSRSQPSDNPAAELQSSLEVRLAARAMPFSAIRHRPPVPRSRIVRQPSRTSGTLAAPDASRDTPASSSAGNAPLARIRQDPVNGNGPSPESASPMLNLIDQQTCTGGYLPQTTLASINWINVIQARFFQKADGTSWLTLATGGDYPVTRRVTVTGDKVEFVGFRNTVFTMSPRGTNHFTGTTERPYGTVDLTCGRS